MIADVSNAHESLRYLSLETLQNSSYHDFSAFDKNSGNEVLFARLYVTDYHIYCCLRAYCNGINALGCGGDDGTEAHRSCAAFQSALDDAGITLSDDLTADNGYTLIDAIKAIATALGVTCCHVNTYHVKSAR